jgi:hypothetical protein
MTSLAATVAALALTAEPAFAVGPTGNVNASARARILRPLQLQKTQDFNLGDIVLSGAAPFSATVSLSQAGALTCPATVTCSGTTAVAKYKVIGTNNQNVTVNANDVTLTGSNGGSLMLKMKDSSNNPYYPTVVALGSSGNSGVEFSLGGEITVADTTTDGVYTGTFDVTADYQ